MNEDKTFDAQPAIISGFRQGQPFTELTSNAKTHWIMDPENPYGYPLKNGHTNRARYMETSPRACQLALDIARNYDQMP